MIVAKHKLYSSPGNTKTGGLESLLEVAMNAWHSLIERHYSFLDGMEVPYQFNERTTSGAFGTALVLAHPGSVLSEVDAKKIASIGRSDVEWDTYLDQQKKIRIRFEAKQNRVTNDFLDSDGINKVVFGLDGLIAQSIRDIGKIQGHKRFHTKSRDNAFHVGLLFVRVTNPSDDTSFIKSTTDMLGQLGKKLSFILVRKNEKKEQEEKKGNKYLSNFYSCSYLHVPDNKDVPALITIALLYRQPDSI